MRRLAFHLGGIAVATGALVVLAEEPAGAGLPGAGIVRDAIDGAMGWTFDGVTAGIARWVLDAVSHFVGGAPRIPGRIRGPGCRGCLVLRA